MPVERQQGGHVYGQGVKSAVRVTAKPGRGTFIQGNAPAIPPAKKEKLDLGDLTIAKPAKKVAFV